MTDSFGALPSGGQVPLGPGSRIAGYVIEEQVGAGGMSVVFRARDEALRRFVAVKVLSPALAADEEFRTRFLHESWSVAAVEEPHIVPVYAAGEANGVLYIATRYVSGGDLASQLRRNGGPLAPERAASLIAQVAAALDAAHAAGLVHRDVKPGNVLIDNVPGRPEHAYLTDFGLSKAASSVTGLTASGMFIGTPDYCAPEQIVGKPPVTARSDQYALGCVTFNLLTGTVPYPREETMATLFAHINDPVPSLTALRPELPEAIDAVLAKAMAKSPADRYESCGDFATALRAALAPSPAVAPSLEAVAVPVPPAASGESPETKAAEPARAIDDSLTTGPETITIASAAGEAGPGTQTPSHPATVQARKPTRPRHTRKRTIIAGSVAGTVLLAGGIASAVTLLISGPTPTILATPGGTGIWEPSSTYSQNGTLLAAEGSGTNEAINTVYLWSGSTYKYIRSLTLPDNYNLCGLAFSPDDKTLTAVDCQGGTYQWSLVTGHGAVRHGDYGPIDKGALNAVISDDGSTVAVQDAARDGVDIINVATGAITGDLTDPDSAPLFGTGDGVTDMDPTALSISNDGSRLTVADAEGNIYVWNVRTQQVITTLQYNPADSTEGGWAPATISGDGKLVLFGQGESLLDLASRTDVVPEDLPGDDDVILSPNGRFIAGEAPSSSKTSLNLWDVATGALIATINLGPNQDLTFAALSPNGKDILTTGSYDAPDIWRFS